MSITITIPYKLSKEEIDRVMYLAEFMSRNKGEILLKDVPVGSVFTRFCPKIGSIVRYRKLNKHNGFGEFYCYRLDTFELEYFIGTARVTVDNA